MNGKYFNIKDDELQTQNHQPLPEKTWQAIANEGDVQ